MIFGNWVITGNSIVWKGERESYEIPSAELNTIIKFNSDVAFYKAILNATEEDWLTQNDLYDLNYAFIYAIAKFDIAFDYEIFDATLAQQYERFEEEDEDDDDDEE